MRRTVVVLVGVLVAVTAFIGVRASNRSSKTDAMAAAERAGRHPTAIAVQWSWTHLDWRTHEIYDL